MGEHSDPGLKVFFQEFMSASFQSHKRSHFSFFSLRRFSFSQDEAVEAMEVVSGLFGCTSSEDPGHQLWSDLGVW